MKNVPAVVEGGVNVSTHESSAIYKLSSCNVRTKLGPGFGTPNAGEF